MRPGDSSASEPDLDPVGTWVHIELPATRTLVVDVTHGRILSDQFASYGRNPLEAVVLRDPPSEDEFLASDDTRLLLALATIQAAREGLAVEPKLTAGPLDQIWLADAGKSG